MLDIIKEFMKVADEHDITWWADGGGDDDVRVT